MQNAPTLMGVCGPQNKLLIYLSSTFSWGGGGACIPFSKQCPHLAKDTPVSSSWKGNEGLIWRSADWERGRWMAIEVEV